MEMPQFLPINLQKYQTFENEEVLLSELKKEPKTFILFLKSVIDDKAWHKNYTIFLEEALRFLTVLARENKLTDENLKEIQKKIINYPDLIATLPLDILLVVGGIENPANSFLFKAASPFFSDSIQNQVSAENKKVILNGVSFDLFKMMEEYVLTENVADLWKKSQEELKEIRKKLAFLKMDAFGSLCEAILKRYLNRENVLETLLEAHKEGWADLKHDCFDFINSLSWGVKLHPSKPLDLIFEFLEFNDRSLIVFDKLKPFITHFIARNKLTEHAEFKSCLQACPLLIQLNIATSLTFNDTIFNAPSNLSELDLSSCIFLDATILGRIFSYFQDLKTLNISDNIQLNYTAFQHFTKLKKLTSLNISKNPQIHDEDFRLIVQSIPKVIDLDCSDCKNISDIGFFELSRGLKHLIFLNLERTQISDGLLIELGSRAFFLEEINLLRCPKLTPTGILKFIKQARALKYLMIAQREELILKIKKEKPYLKLRL